ncbi:type VI secretion system lipoprotein IglE [Francisella sp. LA112445]|uniref:type VI secretion system lipoprotein IglE n=1 Tax=Francisella sp. LA112445 TaxID=1395624 RepID=UPI001788C255|nr:type VI secretion system lipoprotein IglE [Francisella sp. LA112445]QIW10520.1 hypothetical protein FIP56_07345 [Francisella sp. LA112445]
MYNNNLSKLLLATVVALGITGCASDGLYVENNVPKTKVVLESQPNKSTFYSDTYQSVTQRIYDDNIKIINLKTGENKLELNQENKNYAVYFILPNTKVENWKYLISSDSANKFTINDKSIEKD